MKNKELVLHKGNLFWPKHTSLESIPLQSAIEEEFDVLVVGSGMSGALSAYRLGQKGYKVLMIEKDSIISGSTAANTGLIQYMSDQGMVEFSKQIGEEKAKRFYDQSKEAVEILIDLDKEIDEIAEETFETIESLILATRRKKKALAKAEAAMQESYGYDAEYWDAKELEKINLDAHGALKVATDIAINSYGFVFRLLRQAVKDFGLVIVEGTEFLEASKAGELTLVRMQRGAETIEKVFPQVIIACGYNPPVQYLEKLDKDEN